MDVDIEIATLFNIPSIGGLCFVSRKRAVRPSEATVNTIYIWRGRRVCRTKQILRLGGETNKLFFPPPKRHRGFAVMYK